MKARIMSWSVALTLVAAFAFAQMGGGPGIYSGKTTDTVEVTLQIMSWAKTEGVATGIGVAGTGPNAVQRFEFADGDSMWMGIAWRIPPDYVAGSDMALVVDLFAGTAVDGTLRLQWDYLAMKRDDNATQYLDSGTSGIREIDIQASTGSGGDINTRFSSNPMHVGLISGSTLAAGDLLRLSFGRDGKHVDDTYAGTVDPINASIRYLARR